MKKNLKKHPAIAIVMVFLLLILLLGSILFIGWQQSLRLGNNVKLGEIDLSRRPLAEAEALIGIKARELEERGLVFFYEENQLKIPSRVIAFDSEMSYEIFSIDEQATFEKLLTNHKNNYWLNKLIFWKPTDKEIPRAIFRLHEERWRQTLTTSFSDLEKEAQNAHFAFEDEQLYIAPEQLGLTINYETNLELSKNSLAQLNLNNLPLDVKIIKPTITTEDLIYLEEAVSELIANNVFKLEGPEKSWVIPSEEIITWLTIDKQEPDILLLDKKKIRSYLEIELAPEIDRPAQLPTFTIENEKIHEWQPGKSGQKLLIEDSVQKIMDSLLIENHPVKLAIEETMRDDATGLAKEIKEIIGIGHSNFAGSPYNRRHNIRVGAEVFHGIIIAPDEEFSILKNLGPVNASTGYLPELVIKDNQTIPEYGGGLCQISTTLFRSALNSGLPITARQNHSYRVSYYEPAGMDASIYNPWPDLRFINDTGNHILIQARIENNDIYFDFWGTNDGRQVEVGNPLIYNIVSPPPTKIIISDELAPGERKCTERAHNGASTHFDYIVEYPDGEVIEKRFHSYYVPWQEVCLVGRDKPEEEKTEEENNNQIND